MTSRLISTPFKTKLNFTHNIISYTNCIEQANDGDETNGIETKFSTCNRH